MAERHGGVPARATGSRRPSATRPRRRPSCAPRPRPRRRATGGRWTASRTSGATCSRRFELATRARRGADPPSASHAVLPLRRHRRRPAASDRRRAALPPAPLRRRPEGFWLPECAYRPASSRSSPSAACGSSAPTRARTSAGLAALVPVRAGAGLVAFTLDWEAVELVWSQRRLSLRPAYAEFHRQSMEGTTPLGDSGAAYDPEAAGAQASASTQTIRRTRRRPAWGLPRPTRDAPGLVTFAIDTELLGHWWSEGPRLARGGLCARSQRTGSAW